MPNENCLHGIACPECGQEDRFRIQGEAMFYVTDDGTDSHGDVEWDDHSKVVCVECRHEGLLYEFSGNSIPKDGVTLVSQVRHLGEYDDGNAPIVALMHFNPDLIRRIIRDYAAVQSGAIDIAALDEDIALWSESELPGLENGWRPAKPDDEASITEGERAMRGVFLHISRSGLWISGHQKHGSVQYESELIPLHALGIGKAPEPEAATAPTA